MRTFDFSKLGGFPLSQDGLDFMQKAYQEPLKALAELGGTDPHIISGIVETAGTVSPGYLYYAGELIPFVGGAVGATIVINSYKTTLQFGDGNNYDVQTRKEAAFGTGTVQFNYADLKPFQIAFAARTRTDWITLIETATAKVYYKADRMAGTVSVRGSLLRNNPGGAPDPGLLVPMGVVIPEGIRPVSDLYFSSMINQHAGSVKDFYGTIYRGSNWMLGQDGVLSFFNGKLAGVTSITEYFSFTYNL